MTSFSRAGTRPGPGRCLVSVAADGVTPDALLRMSRRQRRSLRTGKLPAKNGRALAKIFLSKGEGVEQRIAQKETRAGTGAQVLVFSVPHDIVGCPVPSTSLRTGSLRRARV